MTIPRLQKRAIRSVSHFAMPQGTAVCNRRQQLSRQRLRWFQTAVPWRFFQNPASVAAVCDRRRPLPAISAVADRRYRVLKNVPWTSNSKTDASLFAKGAYSLPAM
jgi:hypothetical protein